MQENSHFNKARHWILDSKIQEENGAFSAWFDKDKGTNSFEYSEITGYGLTTLVFLNDILEETKTIENAGKAMAWLEEKAMTKEGGILTRNYREGEERNEKFSFESGNVLAFDTGMVLNGLVNIYNQTKDEKALNLAKRVAEFLLEKMFDNKKMHAIYNSKEEKVFEAGDKWSTQPGSYHAKISIGLLGLAEITGKKRFEEAAIALCDFAITKQTEEGRFVTNDTNDSTHLHPHCYSCEGLLFMGKKLDKEEYVKAVEKGITWAFENQAADGGINPFFDGNWNDNQRSDVLAQVLRIGTALKTEGLLNTVSNEQFSRLETRLLEMQDESGGFLYGKELDGQERNCINAWCTMFALQAIAWHKGETIDLQRLV